MHTSTQGCIYVCMHALMHTLIIHPCTHACIHACACVSVCVRPCIYVSLRPRRSKQRVSLHSCCLMQRCIIASVCRMPTQASLPCLTAWSKACSISAEFIVPLMEFSPPYLWCHDPLSCCNICCMASEYAAAHGHPPATCQLVTSLVWPSYHPVPHQSKKSHERV